MSELAYERLTAADSTFLAIEKANTHMHVAATAIFDKGSLGNPAGGIDIERLRAHIASRLHLIPRYRQRLAYVPIENQAVWVDEEHFNIAYHVRHTSLPAPGTTAQLKRLAGRIMSQQLDRAKPLWEFWVIEGLSEGNSFAVIQKTHHCMIDGVSGVDLMAVLMSTEPVTEVAEPEPWVPRVAPGQLELAWSEAWRHIRDPAQLLARAPEAIRSPTEFLAGLSENLGAVGEAVGASMERTSRTPFNRKIGPHRRMDWLEMDLARLKQVKTAAGTTLNDVVLATVAGAIRTFLVSRRVRPDGLRLRANVPVSIRSDEQHGTLGNQIALWMTDLPVHCADPLERLTRVHATTAKLKSSRQVLGAQVLASVSDLTSSTLLSLAVRLSARSRPFNMVVTNIPGPQMGIYLLDGRMKEIYPMVNLLENQGIGVALFSYDGRLYWGIMGDWDLAPDLAGFVDAIRGSFEELYEAAIGGGTAAGAASEIEERA
ncbi:MAG: diacylglycerol O-acyltransferase [Hyphomicrobiaceae bacterium]|jgi:diacylglycerol O-acyltransferase